MKIASYKISDFSGGVRRDKSPLELQKNELLDARNVGIDERGRLKVRLGSQQFGDTITGTIDNSFCFVRVTTGSAPTTQFLVNNTASTCVLSRLEGTRVTVAAVEGATSVTTNDSGGFAASGVIEIDGDRITYSSVAGGVFSGISASGITGVNMPHAVGAPVHQWATLAQSGTALNGRCGIYYAVLNNICFISGAIRMKQYDGTTVSDVTSPGVIFLTNYRDRLYGAGDGGSGNDPRRISFSARGDGTSWAVSYASDFFDVEDQSGENISALKVLNDRLGIFKTNSIWTYDEVELKQRIPNVGAYNQKVVQEIDDGKIMTFCPEGVFITNLFSAKQVGDPVRQYWENFVPTYETTTKRVCNNTFAWTRHNSYLLFIGSITDPTTTAGVVLEYNTKTDSWTVHEGGFPNFFHANEMHRFLFGDDNNLVERPAVFAGDTAGHIYRLNENTYYNTNISLKIGTNLYQDLYPVVIEGALPVSASFETGLYDLTYPELFKTFKNLRVITESGVWMVEYRVENETGIVSQYKNLGSTKNQNCTLPFPSDAQGYRIGLRFSSVNVSSRNTFNGFVFEDTEIKPRP